MNGRGEILREELGDRFIRRRFGDERANDHGGSSDEPHDSGWNDSTKDGELPSKSGHGVEGNPADKDRDDTGVGPNEGGSFPVKRGDDEWSQGGKSGEAPNGEVEDVLINEEK